MNIIETHIPGLFEIEPRVFADKRGYFFESYNQEKFHQKGLTATFVQDNESKSSYGTIRGLHYQQNPYSQTKLVRVIEGEVYDVAVDLRKGSPTFGKWHGVVLSAENKKQFYIPKGFAHGFSVLSETAIFVYKCDNLYHPETEGGILYNDEELEIDWKIPSEKNLISDKDLLLKPLSETVFNFAFE